MIVLRHRVHCLGMCIILILINKLLFSAACMVSFFALLLARRLTDMDGFLNEFSVTLARLLGSIS